MDSHVFIDGCAEDISTSLPVEAFWPESDIGVHRMPCPCGNLIDAASPFLVATRECQGDFATQATWKEPDVSSCLDINYNICRLAQVSNIHIT